MGMDNNTGLPPGHTPLFLGLDLSTQQLKAIVTTENGRVVHETSVHFDRDLPQYGTKCGAIQGIEAGEVVVPIELWIAAFDLLLERMAREHVSMERIVGVSGAAQQHGSVYWSHSAGSLLSSLDPTKSLAAQLVPDAFSIPLSPIWQDSSTTKECKALEEAVGGKQALADLTGSSAYERFTGPQIMKIRNRRPDLYASTSRISLISSFIPSLFLGEIAPIEVSDASGMNLMNIFTHKWDDRLLEVCGGSELRAKLGPEPVRGGTFVGKIAPWWVHRWSFNPECFIAPFAGDISATMASFSFGDAILSLGTSTTYLLNIPPSKIPPARFTHSHLLAHPADEDASIAMLCYKNGGLAREQVRDTYTAGSWTEFNKAIESTPPGNDGFMGLYFPIIEIIPDGVHGNFFFKDGQPVRGAEVPDAAHRHARAIIESQFLSVKSRSDALLPPKTSKPLKRLVVAGGSSANQTIRQLAADIFGLPTYVSETKEAAGHGGAVLALYAWWRAKKGGSQGTFQEFKNALGVEDNLRLVAEPNLEVTKVYEGLIERYMSCEDQVVRMCAERRTA